MKRGLKKCAVVLLMPLSIAPLAAKGSVTTGDNEGVVNQSQDRALDSRDLKEVTVSATRSERKTDNVPRIVTVTTAEEIQELGARNVGDVFKDSPDITVPQQTGRFSLAFGSQGRGGQESINIRGLQGNNVLLLVDGIRVPNQFSFGSLSSGRGNFLDVDGFRKIEVVRGPSSTQYGSDGLAGIVHFQTFNPRDFIQKGTDKGGFARTGYSSVDNSSNTTFAYAGKTQDMQGMVLGNIQSGHQLENQGSNYSTGINRSAPNPADYRNWYVLSKALLRINSVSSVGITYESQNVGQNVNNLSDLSRAVATSTASDTTSRDRISGEYHYRDSANEVIQAAKVMLYRQDASVTQKSYQESAAGSGRPYPWRSRTNTYSQNTKGLNTSFESNTTAILNQRLTYGLDWSSAEISSQINAAGNGASITPAPSSKYDLGGAFFQSEMEFGDLTLIPAIRYDSYSIQPQTGLTSSNSGSAVSPALGAVWNWATALRPFINWGRAFGAPTPDQALATHANSGPGSNYRVIANPNLRPQTGNGFELGSRGRAGSWRYQVSAYANRYDDFIAQVTTQGSLLSPIHPAILQYQNLNSVSIRGWDVRTDWAFAERWQANAAMAYSNGQQTQDGVTAPLNTIQPLRAVVGMRYDAIEWGAFANLIWNQGKAASNVNFNSNTGGTANQFLTPASTILNLTGYWKPTKQLTLNFNLNNVFNSTYWNWAGVQGSVTTVSSPMYNAAAAQQAATAAPRNAQISLRYDF
jgi:hemoglobin/transferrin/lactoferrin receptor protein